jgi:signal transduction histidine kinase
LECDASLPPVLADRDRLEQVLVNLLGNALTYTERGSITLKAWTQDRQMWIAVIDTGVGIAPEDLLYVFDRFWRSGSAREKMDRDRWQKPQKYSKRLPYLTTKLCQYGVSI